MVSGKSDRRALENTGKVVLGRLLAPNKNRVSGSRAAEAITKGACELGSDIEKVQNDGKRTLDVASFNRYPYRLID